MESAFIVVVVGQTQQDHETPKGFFHGFDTLEEWAAHRDKEYDAWAAEVSAAHSARMAATEAEMAKMAAEGAAMRASFNEMHARVTAAMAVTPEERLRSSMNSFWK